MKTPAKFLLAFIIANNYLEINSSQKKVLDLINNQKKQFGSWSISKELFEFIRSILPDGKTILELGSGWGTSQLVKYYTVFSVEHDKRWLNKYGSYYIYAPIKNNWYDVNILKKTLPKNYDLILVDGPTGAIGRGGFFYNLDLFNTNATIIFDDVDRPAEFNLMENVAKKIGRDFTIYTDSANKNFGVIFGIDS